MQQAEEEVLAFLQRHTDASTGHHLAGSSVHVDLAFLRRRMPRLAAHVPYRIVVRPRPAGSCNCRRCALPPVRRVSSLAPQAWDISADGYGSRTGFRSLVAVGPRWCCVCAGRLDGDGALPALVSGRRQEGPPEAALAHGAVRREGQHPAAEILQRENL